MSEGSFQVGDLVSLHPSSSSYSIWKHVFPATVDKVDDGLVYIPLRNSPSYLVFISAELELAAHPHIVSEPRLKDTNPKAAFGKAKSPVGLFPPVALIHAAESFRAGAAEYGPANWRKDPVSASTYRDALERHFLAWCDGEDIDRKSGIPHLGHIIANAAILLDAESCGMLVDDRPPPGHAADLIAKYTKDIKDAS